jgi:Uma2 family endonuclease
MATQTSVPLEEYLRTYYEPDMEYVDGQLVERHVGEYFHGLLQGAIVSELNQRRRARRFRVFPETRVRINDRPRYRIPDISVMSLPHEVTSVLTRPHLVIEIVSPDDEVSEMFQKVADYAEAGIPYVWIVDPYKRSVMEAGQGTVHHPETMVLSTPLVGEIDFAELFAELDEPAE